MPVHSSVKPFDQEITAEEETDEDAFTELEDEEIMPREQLPPPLLVNPVREITTEQQTPVQPLMDSVDEEITSLDKDDFLADLLEEKSESLQKRDSDFLEDLVDEETDLDSLGDLIDEESTPGEQTASPFLTHSVRREILAHGPNRFPCSGESCA